MYVLGWHLSLLYLLGWHLSLFAFLVFCFLCGFFFPVSVFGSERKEACAFPSVPAVPSRTHDPTVLAAVWHTLDKSVTL